MINLVKDNPYRLLGVCSNASARERIANINKLKAYLKVGKKVSFPFDLDDKFGEAERTQEGVNEIPNRINMPQDQLKYALFWFINVTPIDKMALDHVQTGNFSKAKELLEKLDNYSSLINKGVIAVIENDMELFVSFISKVIHTEDYRLRFVKSICGEVFQISEVELATLYIEALLNEVDSSEFTGVH